ncbi:MAG: SPOR domain-containing protein [Gallionella sp.]|nr:SPOR domain-containing protein [Gallionella sp.]
MSRNTGNKSAAPRKSGSPLLTGILVGMIIGVAMAAVLAWFIMKSPSPFVQKEPVVVKPNAPVVASGAEVKPHAPAPTQPGVAASGVPGDKPRFEFYKVLTDKDAGGAGAKPADKAVEAKPAVTTQYLQAGSFASVEDAENLKAKLAMLGIEAAIQTVAIPEKGVWHRVRLGPYKNADEIGRVRTTLKQNGVDSTPIPAH